MGLGNLSLHLDKQVHLEHHLVDLDQEAPLVLIKHHQPLETSQLVLGLELLGQLKVLDHLNQVLKESSKQVKNFLILMNQEFLVR